MTTARDLITMSLRSIGVIHSGETPSAEESTDALDTLNQMLNSWLLNGIDLEYSTISSLNTTLPYPDDHIGPMRWNLAVYLAADYGIEVTPTIAARAMEGYQQIRNAYINAPEMTLDSALSAAYSPNRGVNL